MTIQAIPTIYRGVQFRSRLEADWAATLDSYGVLWWYEPEGYALPDGTWYSPDFWLPQGRAWLEVKGSHDLGISKVEAFAAALWTETTATHAGEYGSPMVLIGREPKHVVHNMWWHTMNGVMGPGKMYSVCFLRCPNDHVIPTALSNINTCRACGVQLAWKYEIECLDWTRLPRPAGKAVQS